MTYFLGKVHNVSSTFGFPENVTQWLKYQYGRETKSESLACCRGRVNIFGGSEKFFYAHHPQLEALLLRYRELNFRGMKRVPSRHRSC